MKSAGDEEVAIAEPEDLREEDQQQERAEERRHAEVGGGRSPVRHAARANPAERDPVKQ
jgi:hypothetical protein